MPTLGRKYLVVGTLTLTFIAVLVTVVRITPASDADLSPKALIQPIVALAGLTAFVALLMVVYRNLAVIRGTASERYFQTYGPDAPSEWIERPARLYMNLLELPVLFYLVCLLMLKTGNFDRVQVSLAWIFVATRFVHAFIYIGFNYVPFRFAAFLLGLITLVVIWARFTALNF